VEIITLLVMETKRYYQGHHERTDDGPSALPDVTEVEMLVFLAITIQMGHCIWDKLTTGQITKQFHTRQYSSAMKQERYLHIQLLHFTDNINEPDMT
jgi:hypothetical protein